MLDQPQPRPKSTKEVRRVAGHMARLGQVLSGRYELLELLGHGGMGAVYKAKHLEMDRLVAVKMLLPDVADDPEMNKRFLREAKASGRINHPNVVQLIDFGEGPEGEAYIVIEYLQGIGLDELIDQEGLVEVNRAARIFTQICDGVAKAHAKGIIHRDLKPSNIMLVEEEGEKDFVKVLDFGLAKALDPCEESQKLTNSGEVFGSPIYMSPEQCLGHQLDNRADIYALGVLMYECLTGKVPFLGTVVAETIARQMTEQPKSFAQIRPDIDLKIPESLEAVVMKALAKNPDQRQTSAEQLKQEIIAAMSPTKKAKFKRTTEVISKAQYAEAAAVVAGASAAPAGRGQAAESSGVVLSKGVLISIAVGVGALLAVGVVIGMSLSGKGPEPHMSRQAAGGPEASASSGMNRDPSASKTKDSSALKTKDSSALKMKDHASANNENPNKESAAPNTVSADNSANSAVDEQNRSNDLLAQQEEQRRKRKARQEALAAAAARKKAVREKAAVRQAVSSHHATQGTAESAASDTEYHPRHRRDWHDYSYGVERKDHYTRNWSVPLAGSKSHE